MRFVTVLSEIWKKRGEWISKLGHIHSMDNYAIIRKDKLFPWCYKSIMVVIKCLIKNYDSKFYVIIVR